MRSCPDPWVIAQSRPQVEATLKLRPELRAGANWLATTPDAFEFCRELGMRSQGIHQFSTEIELQSIAEQNFPLISSLVNDLDARLQEAQYRPGLQPFRALEFQLKCNVDSIRFAIVELIGFLDEMNPSELICPTFLRRQQSERPDLTAHNLYSPLGTSTEVILRQADLPVKVSFLCLGAEASPPKVSVLGRAKALVNPNFVTQARRDGIDSVLSASHSGKRGQRILVIGECPNATAFLDHCVKAWEAKTNWWTTPGFRGCSRGLTDVLARVVPQRHGSAEDLLHDLDALIPNTFLENSLVAGILRSVVSHIAGTIVPVLADIHQYSEALIQRLEPHFIVATTLGRGDMQVIGQAAKGAGVPLVSFQHGGSYGYANTPWLFLSDLRADFFAGLGERVGEGIRSLNLPSDSDNFSHPEYVNVGWSDAPPELSPREGVTVLYAPTGLMGDSRYGPYHNLPDIRYCALQLKVLEVLASIDGVQVLFRPHPKDKVINPVVKKAMKLHNVEISPSEETFLDAFERASAVVLDAPTTTLIQVLGGGRPIVFFDAGIFEWMDEGKLLADEVCNWVDASEGWEQRLKVVLKAVLSDDPPPTSKTPFQEAYADPEFRPERLLDSLSSKASFAHHGSPTPSDLTS